MIQEPFAAGGKEDKCKGGRKDHGGNVSEKCNNNVSMDEPYMNNCTFIEKTGLGVEICYLDYLIDNTIPPSYFSLLRAMAMGLPDTDRKDDQFKNIIKKG